MSYFADYLAEIRDGKITVGRELMTELERLEHDLADPRYQYDTADAENGSASTMKLPGPENHFCCCCGKRP